VDKGRIWCGVGIDVGWQARASPPAAANHPQK
jgi:hypothetical protein